MGRLSGIKASRLAQISIIILSSVLLINNCAATATSQEIRDKQLYQYYQSQNDAQDKFGSQYRDLVLSTEKVKFAGQKEIDTSEVPSIISMSATSNDIRCRNGIVGLFCPDYGCYYNSDCFDNYCNMYSKCEKKAAKHSFDSSDQEYVRKGNGANNEANQNAQTSTSQASQLPASVTNSTDTPADQSTSKTNIPPSAVKDLKKDHFSESPFGSSGQLNTFLFWFGVVSALLIMAFIIQCCREIARGDQNPVVNHSVTEKQSGNMNMTHDDPLSRTNGMDPRSLLSNGQVSEDRNFQNKAYMMHSKQKQMYMGVRTPQALQHAQDTDRLNRKFNSGGQFNNRSQNITRENNYHSLNDPRTSLPHGNVNINNRSRLNQSGHVDRGNIFIDSDPNKFVNKPRRPTSGYV